MPGSINKVRPCKNHDVTTQRTKTARERFEDHVLESSSSGRNLNIVVDEQLRLSEGTSQQENLIGVTFGYTNSGI